MSFHTNNYIAISTKQLKAFSSNDFKIEYKPLRHVYVKYQYDYSTIYITHIFNPSMAFNRLDEPKRETNVLGNPIINLLNGKVIGHVNGETAVFYSSTILLEKEEMKPIIKVSMPNIIFPDFIKVKDIKTERVEDCGIPIDNFEIILRTDVVEKIVTCMDMIKYVKIADLELMTNDYYLYKYGKKVYDIALYNYVQRLIKNAKKSDNDENIRRIVSEDKRIKYMKIDHENIRVDFEVPISYIRVYSLDDGKRENLKLKRPLILKGRISSSLAGLREPQIIIDSKIPHPNVVRRQYNDGMTIGGVCVGNVAVNIATLSGIVSTVRSILEVLQYPNLDNIDQGYIFLKFLIDKGYLDKNEIHEDILEFYGF